MLPGVEHMFCLRHLYANCKKHLVDYISNYYTPAAYVACYSPMVNPINGANLWPTTNMDKILPPTYRVKPGRPRKLRRREHDENPNPSRSTRIGTRIRCSRCKQIGHNKAYCKQPTVETQGGDVSAGSGAQAAGNGSQVADSGSQTPATARNGVATPEPAVNGSQAPVTGSQTLAPSFQPAECGVPAPALAGNSSQTHVAGSQAPATTGNGSQLAEFAVAAVAPAVTSPTTAPISARIGRERGRAVWVPPGSTSASQPSVGRGG